MNSLHKKKCVACDGNTIPFDVSEIHKYLKKVDGWDVKNNNENYYLEKGSILIYHSITKDYDNKSIWNLIKN